jgi:hypothetical protein
MVIPSQYISYFSGDDPKEGPLSVEPGWFLSWPPDEIERWNHAYLVEENAPGILGFGSNGSSEMLAFDSNGCVVTNPIVGMAADAARPVANSWTEFEMKIES